MVPPVDTEPAAHKLAEDLKGRSFGAVHVLDVQSGLDEADGDVVLHVTLLLSDPTGNKRWSSDDLTELRHAVLQAVGEAKVDLNIYLTLRPATDERQVDDEELPFD